ncbi:MAG: LON peptidase substrate-binding domain-containing protein, partial [Dehalococcoidia bacterium]
MPRRTRPVSQPAVELAPVDDPADPPVPAEPAAAEEPATPEAAVEPEAGATPVPEAAEPVIPEIVPAISAGGSVLYPAIVVPFVTAEPAEVEAINAAVSSPSRVIAIFPQEIDAEGNPTGGIRSMGTVASVLRMARGASGGVQAIIQGLQRVRLVEVLHSEPYYRVRIEPLEDRVVPSPEMEALLRNVAQLVQRAITLSEAVPNELALAMTNITNAGNLADFVAANMPFKPEERYRVLEMLDVTDRLRYVHELLTREVEVLEIGQQIRSQVQGELDKRQREYVLREQLRAIQKELGEEEQPELAELRRRLDEANLPEAARAEADREMERLATIPQASPEYQVARTYLEWIA